MKFLVSSTIGAQITLILSTIITIYGFVIYDITVSTLLLILAGYFIYGCLGVVVTFHRNLTHKSYTTHSLIERIFSIFGCLGGTGSSIAWIATHINHHLKSDKDGDPHNPQIKGLKIFTLDYANEIAPQTKWRMREIITNPFHQFLHRYYFAIVVTWSILLFLVGGLYLTIFFHLAPLVITAVMSNVVNYVGHMPNWLGSSRRYNLNDRSSNNWIFAIPSWGETWHNNHHRYPKNYSCGQRWWEIDISAYVIKMIRYNDTNSSQQLY